MRITNGILINNSLTNINANKSKIDNLLTQLTYEKKIQRPSDDPIIAIRALRFRSTLAEIDQYLTKNIPDADAWLTATDDAMGNISKVLGDITEYCNEAVNGYYDETNKNTIVEELKAFRSQIYSDANADCAGRTIFTGFKTDSTLTFLENNSNKYQITQEFNADSFDKVSKVYNSLDITGINGTNVGGVDIDAIKVPETVDAYRVRLAYDGTLEEDGLVITSQNPAQTYTTVLNDSSDPSAYRPGDNEVFYLADTGELIVGADVYNDLMTAEGFSFTYTKEGFKKEELDPTQYFDCVDITDPANPVTYTNRNQEISYEVNFNQMLKINTQGKNVFTQDMTRDLDDIIKVVDQVITVTNKKENLQKLYDETEEGSTEREKVQKLMDLCDRELDFVTENVKNAFSKGITLYQKHQDMVGLARADVGARQNRLALCESRLEAQRLTVKNLKSLNEDVNVANVAVELDQAQSIFDASLKSVAQVVQKKLLDFL